MPSTALNISSFFLSLMGLFLLLASMVSNNWKVSSSATSVISANWLFEGLWMGCATNALGSVQCKKFSSLFSLEPHLQACRALMIISIILGFLATAISLFGLKCIKVGSNDERKKGKIALAGGLNFIAAGLCSMIAISWYAAKITAQFFDPLYGGTKYELGYALYLGWAGSLLTILGGAFLCCSYKGKKKSKPGIYKHDYSSARNAPSHLEMKRSSENIMASKAYI